MDSFTFKSFDEYAYVSLQDFLSEKHLLYYMISIKLPSGIERRTPPWDCFHSLMGVLRPLLNDPLPYRDREQRSTFDFEDSFSGLMRDMSASPC